MSRGPPERISEGSVLRAQVKVMENMRRQTDKKPAKGEAQKIYYTYETNRVVLTGEAIITSEESAFSGSEIIKLGEFQGELQQSIQERHERSSYDVGLSLHGGSYAHVVNLGRAQVDKLRSNISFSESTGEYRRSCDFPSLRSVIFIFGLLSNYVH